LGSSSSGGALMDHHAYRHHTATRPVVVFVPVPFERGSPAPLNRGKPPAYPVNQRSPWRPQRSIPPKQRQAERIVQIMRELAEREADARSMLTPRPDLMRAWLAKAA
jgi:hypothetical protein